jgi:hypothetical protein
VDETAELGEVLAARWPAVLDHVDEAVLVIDRQRTIRYINPPACRLLAIAASDAVGGPCRHTTHGVDCGPACPLTYALECELDLVEDFPAVYETGDGRSLPLKVTVIPLRDAAGELTGAIEILHPREPDPGFFLAGTSPLATALRGKLSELAGGSSHVVLVGEAQCCADVAEALHRFSGLGPDLLRHWHEGWQDERPWPPGTVLASADQAAAALAAPPPEDWRVVVAADQPPDLDAVRLQPLQVVRLPDPRQLRQDLPLMLAAWVQQRAPGVQVTPAALDRLARMAVDVGWQPVWEVLRVGLAAAADRLDDCHLALDCYGGAMVDELLREPNPLAALEGRLLREVLDRCGWRMNAAAERLGISRVTLWRKLKEHGIEK